HLDSTGDRFAASLWYDGKTVTIASNKAPFYGQADAPPTIDAAVLMLMDRLDTPLPVAGFLLADPYAKMTQGLKTAFDAGTARPGSPSADTTAASPSATARPAATAARRWRVPRSREPWSAPPSPRVPRRSTRPPRFTTRRPSRTCRRSERSSRRSRPAAPACR